MSSIQKERSIDDSDFVYVSRKTLLRAGDAETKIRAESKDLKVASQGAVEVKEDKSPAAFAAEIREVLRGVNARMTRGKGQGMSSSLPPRIQTSPQIDHVYRFYSTSSSFTSSTVADLLGVGGVVDTLAAGTLAYSVCTSVRIKKLIVWPAAGPTSLGSGLTQLYWNIGASAQIPDEEIDASIPNGVSVTGAVVFKPPKNSTAAMWSAANGGAFVMFSGSFPVGSVIDAHLSFRQANNFASIGYSLASGSTGSLYYLALDGAGTNRWVPVGLPTTH